MKKQAPALAPRLRSNTQGDLLALLLLNPDTEYSLSEIGLRIGVLSTTVHRKVDHLVKSGMLTDRRVGTARLVRTSVNDRLYEPTRALIEATYGPRVILESILDAADGIEAAYIFGSWAARYADEQGHAPNDIDVLVVGEASRRYLARLATDAEKAIHLKVNIERISPEAWHSQEGSFIETLLSRPLIDLNLRRVAA